MSVKLDQQALLLSRPVFFPLYYLFIYLFIYIFFSLFFFNICIFFHSLPTIMMAHIIELIPLQTLMSVVKFFGFLR